MAALPLEELFDSTADLERSHNVDIGNAAKLGASSNVVAATLTPTKPVDVEPVAESGSETGVSVTNEEDELDDQFDDMDYEPDD